jgi:hypothetical protein
MACPDRLGQEQVQLDPTDLGVAGRNVGDMGNGEETEEDPEDLEDLVDLAGLAVVDLRGEQELVLVLVLVEDEIRSEEGDSLVSMMYTNYSKVKRVILVIRRKATEISTWGLRSRRTKVDLHPKYFIT